MKKTIILLVLMVAAIFALSSCAPSGSTPPPDSPEVSDTQPTVEVTPPVDATAPADSPKPASGGEWTITPDAKADGETLIVTATGLADGFSQFDLSMIIGGGPGPFTYALWFEPGGTVKFSRDVSLLYQGASERSVTAGEAVTVDESFSEYAVTLDDGNSIILIAESAPGNFAQLPPDTPFSEFPGKITMPDGTAVDRVEPPPSLEFSVFTGSPLSDAELIAMGIPETYANMDGIRSVDAGVYDPIENGADDTKMYPVFLWLHGMSGGMGGQTAAFRNSEVRPFAQPVFQEEFNNGAAYIIAARANEQTGGMMGFELSWLDGPGGFGYVGDGGAFGSGMPVYAPALVQLIKSFLDAHPNADPDRVYVSGFSAGGSMTQQLVRFTEQNDTGVKFAAIAPVNAPMNLSASQFEDIRNVPIWLFAGTYDAATSGADITAVNAVKSFIVDGMDNARVTIHNTILGQNGAGVMMQHSPAPVHANLIFDANVPTNFTMSPGSGAPGAFGYIPPGEAIVGNPPQRDGPHMEYYGTIFDESDGRYNFGANPELSSFSNEGTFVSWLSRWSLDNRP